MAQKKINYSFANDGLGDPLRQAFIKTDDNFDELYANKVDKVIGKELSDVNFTQADKDKLDNVDTSVKPQSDFYVNDPLNTAFIKNKPTKLSDFDNDLEFVEDVTTAGVFGRSAGLWTPININWIKSNESLSLAQRKGDVLHGILDQYTGEEMTLSKVTGTPTVDNVIFFQLGSEYFKRESSNLIDVRWFGAILDGTTDDTTALRNAFLKGVVYGYTIKVPSKSTMLVSGAILNSDSLTGKNLNVIFESGCKINVSGSATSFEGLFYLSQTSIFDINIQGNGIVINCNNKASAGFYLRNNSVSTGGNCIIKDVKVINVYKGPSALLTLACQGVGVGGGFDRIEFNNVVVDTVSYSSLGVSGMEAKGIVAYETIGDVFFINCQVNRVTSETGQDADGYAVFSKRPTELSKTLGKAFFINCNGIDNQGRHIKSQNSTTYISGGVFSRKDVISITQGVDFDFQWGNGTVDNVSFIYEKSTLGISPLGTNFVPIVFQNYTTDAQKISRVSNCSVQTELVLNNFCISLVGGKKTTVELEGNTLKNIKTLSNTSSCISRSFIEFLANQVEDADFEQLELVVNNNNINSSLTLVGYTGAGTLPNLYTKITLIADGNTSISAGSGGRLFGRLSGGFIKKAKIISRNNTGLNCVFTDGWEVDTAELPANTNFSMFLDQTTLLNAPAGLGTTGFVNIRTESESITGYIPKIITLDDGSKSYYTISGTWTRLVNQSDLDLKANDNSVIKTTGNQTGITGTKSFSNSTNTSTLNLNLSNNAQGFVANNANTSTAFVANNTGTGLSYVGQNNGTNTFTVDKFGKIEASKLNLSTTSGTQSVGNANMVEGTVTVTTTAATPNSVIMLTRNSIGITGFISYTTTTGSFTINSNVIGDAGVISYVIFN